MNSILSKTMFNNICTFIAGAGLLSLGLSSFQATGQESTPAEEPPAEKEEAKAVSDTTPAVKPADVTDKELEQAADVYFKIQEIQQKLQDDLAEVEDKEVIQEGIDEARGKIDQAVMDSGFEKGEFEQVMQAVDQDDKLRVKFIQKLEARRPEGERMNQETAMDPEDITPEIMKQAADVYNAMQELNKKVKKELAEVDDQEVIKEKVAEAEKERKKIMKEAGLELDEYGEIMQTIQQDAELGQKFIELIQ